MDVNEIILSAALILLTTLQVISIVCRNNTECPPCEKGPQEERPYCILGFCYCHRCRLHSDCPSCTDDPRRPFEQCMDKKACLCTECRIHRDCPNCTKDPRRLFPQCIEKKYCICSECKLNSDCPRCDKNPRRPHRQCIDKTLCVCSVCYRHTHCPPCKKSPPEEYPICRYGQCYCDKCRHDKECQCDSPNFPLCDNGVCSCVECKDGLDCDHCEDPQKYRACRSGKCICEKTMETKYQICKHFLFWKGKPEVLNVRRIQDWYLLQLEEINSPRFTS